MQILHSDWLPEWLCEQARWDSGFPALAPKRKFSFWPYNESFVGQVCSVKIMAISSWPYLFCIFMTLTNKNAKRNLANIQPSPILISRLVINAYLFYFPASRGLSRRERPLLAGNYSTYQLLQVLSHSSQMSYRDTANNYKVVHIASSVSTCLNYTDVHSILSF